MNKDNLNKTNNYIRELEETIEKFLKPIESIPFNIAIKALYRCEVIPLDLSHQKDIQLRDDLSEVAKIAGEAAYKEGIYRRRPNEVGNDIENYVQRALNQIGLEAETPRTKEGTKKAVGYPDIYFKDRSGRHCYLECKTYNKENITTTQRAFYFSPPAEGKSKVIYDAPHLVLAFEIDIDPTRRQGNKNCYMPVAWKLVSIHSMKVNIKHEFNASNRDMYRENAILSQADISTPL